MLSDLFYVLDRGNLNVQEKQTIGIVLFYYWEIKSKGSSRGAIVLDY